MLPQYEKKGYAFEAANNYLKTLNKNQVGKIIAITKPDNENSITLLKKLGLVFEKSYNENDEILDMYSTIV
jgi:RimJ/RimL family protein N-acetyltransferase